MKKSIRKLTAILLALIMGLSFTYTSYPVYAQDNIQTTGATSEQTENSVAKVGDNYYDDLAEALYKASETGEACDLLQDATITGNHDFAVLSPGVFGKSFDLKLNGFTIDGSSNLKFPGAGRATRIYGSGTINANVIVSVIEFNAPLTINGDITESGVTNLRVLGSGVFRVNGDISEFTQGYKFGENVKVVCSGNFPENSQISSVLDGYELINKNEPSNLKGIVGQPLSTVSLPKDWSWLNKETVLDSSIQTYTARFNTTNYEMEYDFSKVAGYNKDQHYVELELTVNVSEAIAKVVKSDGTEVFYSDIVEAFEKAENSTLYLLKDVEYDSMKDSQYRPLIPANNITLTTGEYTLTSNTLTRYANQDVVDFHVTGNGKDKTAIKVIGNVSGLNMVVCNSKIETYSFGYRSNIYIQSDSSVAGINDQFGYVPNLINGANLYLEEGAELVGTFEQPYDDTKIYTNVQPDKSKYNLKVPTNLELGNTYGLKLSEVFLNHSDIVDKGKIDVSISGIDKEGYITMKSTRNHTVYLPISIDGISSLTNDTVILSAGHRNDTDKQQHYNGNGHDSANLIVGKEMFYIPNNSGEVPTKADLNHEVYSGTLTLTNNIDATTKTINMVYDNRSENKDVPNVSGGVNQIIGTNGRMEYSTSEDSDTWTTCDADNTKVEAGTYYVRYKETENYKSSKPVKVVVSEPEYNISVNKENVNFGTKHIGYKDINFESLEISNTGNVDVSNIKVSLTGINKDSFTLDTKDLKVSLKPNQKASFTVVPNANLEAGTYKAQIEIIADSNIKSVIDISFIVEGHEYESIVTKPTCTTKGYTTHTCKKCKHSYTDSETEILPHNYKEEWKSNETNHWHECDCGVKSDGATHTFKWVIDKPATHLEKGFKHEECSVCGYKKADVEISVAKHTFEKEWSSDKNMHWQECECGAKYAESIHTYKWVVDKEVSSSEKGIKHEECSVCGYKKPSVEIPVVTQSDKDKPSNDKHSANTGVQNNLGLFAGLLGVSVLGIGLIVVLNKRKH